MEARMCASISRAYLLPIFLVSSRVFCEPLTVQMHTYTRVETHGCALHICTPDSAKGQSALSHSPSHIHLLSTHSPCYAWVTTTDWGGTSLSTLSSTDVAIATLKSCNPCRTCYKKHYHPGRIYFKRIPWDIFFCNNFCNHYKKNFTRTISLQCCCHWCVPLCKRACKGSCFVKWLSCKIYETSCTRAFILSWHFL